MRKENIERLSATNIKRSDLHYLHYKSYHFDLFAAIEKYANGDVLDIGCGNKPYKEKFNGLINKYVGCDIVQSSLNKVDVIAPADNIPLAGNTFDTVISTQTIEHVENYQGLVNEAYRLLKPGGYFILSGPFNWQLHEEPYDFFRFSKHGFELVIKNSGFELIDLKENGGMWAVVGQYVLMNIANEHSGRGKKIRFIFRIVKRFNGITFLNRFFEFLDRVDYNTINTINYVIVVRK